MKRFEIKTKICFGEKALDVLKDIDENRVLIITDPFVVKSGMLDLITAPLKAGGKNIEVFCDVVPDTPIDKIAEGVKKLLEYKPQAIVAVGGGSAIDSAKSIREFSLKINNYGSIALIAIPTTSGTGSEVTSFAVVNDTEKKVKYPLVSDSLLADIAILDADLVKSVPPAITADTGMDVFTHALEAYVSTDNNEFSSALAEKTIKIVGQYLHRAYMDGSDMEAREKMHTASTLAGIAFNTAGLGLNHGMAHQLGGAFHIPHGRANAMILNTVIDFNCNIQRNNPHHKSYLPTVKKYAEVAAMLGLSSYNDLMSVRSLQNWISLMIKEMNMPSTISSIKGIDRDDYFKAIDKMADAAMADACTLNNPRTPTKENILAMYAGIWE